MASDHNPTPEDAAARLLAEFQAVGQAVGNALRPVFEGYVKWAAKLAEDPAMKTLMAEYARDPDGFRARVRAERPRACHCFCAKVHPGDHVCNGTAAITRRITTQMLGDVDVPICAPCAAETAARTLAT